MHGHVSSSCDFDGAIVAPRHVLIQAGVWFTHCEPLCSAYSALMPSFLIKGTTNFSSLSSIAASSCGVLDLVSAVRSANFLMTAGAASVVTMAALSLARISGGSLAGANRPV